jgi:hypothetical protein
MVITTTKMLKPITKVKISIGMLVRNQPLKGTYLLHMIEISMRPQT